MIQPIAISSPKFIKKAWGSEEVIINTPLYCGKVLRFISGASFSMHYHQNKDEAWYVLTGQALLEHFDLSDATPCKRVIIAGDVIHVPPGNPHKITALLPTTLLEVSTHHEDSDSYRIGKGASQQ